LQQLAYLADIFNRLNKFNLSIQGHSRTTPSAEVKAAAVKLKLVSWYQVCNKINLIVSIE